MIARRYEAGMIVTHPNRPDWGPGGVLAVQGDAATVYFRDLPIGTAGGAKRTIALLAAMAAWVKAIEGRLAGHAGQHVRSEAQP